MTRPRIVRIRKYGKSVHCLTEVIRISKPDRYYSQLNNISLLVEAINSMLIFSFTILIGEYVIPRLNVKLHDNSDEINSSSIHCNQ